MNLLSKIGFYLDMILDDMIANDLLTAEKRAVVRNALLLKHVHQVCCSFVCFVEKRLRVNLA